MMARIVLRDSPGWMLIPVKGSSRKKEEQSVHQKMRLVNHVMSGYAMIFIISNEIGNLHLLTWILNEKLPRLKNERGKDHQKRFSSNSIYPVNCVIFLLILTHDHRGLTPSSDRLGPRAHSSQPEKNTKRKKELFLSICTLISVIKFDFIVPISRIGKE